jgi:hypothetical protein
VHRDVAELSAGVCLSLLACVQYSAADGRRFGKDASHLEDRFHIRPGHPASCVISGGTVEETAICDRDYGVVKPDWFLFFD